MVRVVVDGREVAVTPGSTVLAAARKLGIDIPALCFLPGNAANTACMACVVRRVDDGLMVPACATEATDGLEVESESERVRAVRRTVLELLLSDHVCEAREGATGSADDAARYPECECAERDVCRLRKYAAAYGADPRRLGGARRAVGGRQEHAEITYEPSKCILCGICVQISQQAGEAVGLTMIGRGFEMRVDVPLEGEFEDALERTARQCAGACPTGALTRKAGT